MRKIINTPPGGKRPPGYQRILLFKGRISSMAVCRDKNGEAVPLIHAGNRIYLMHKVCHPRLITDFRGDSLAMSCGSVCLFTNGERLIMADADGRVKEISTSPDITGCRCAAVYNGRIFLSGNPDLPSVIFYSTPIAGGDVRFESDDHFTDGTGKINIHTIIAKEGSLWLFKSTDDGDGSIIAFGKATRTISTVGRSYKAISISDGFAILTDLGLTVISKIGSEDEKITGITIPDRFIRGDVCLCEWPGGIAIYKNGEIYLARISDENMIINGIGEYSGDRRVYRYTPLCGNLRHRDKRAHRIVTEEVYSRITPEGELNYYTIIGGMEYPVYPTAERTGGVLIPADFIFTDGLRMWFARGQGLYLFSSEYTDMLPYPTENGEPPTEEQVNGYYFAGHMPQYTTVAGSERTNNE